MKLIYERTGQPVEVGDHTHTFRGEPFVITDIVPPKHEASTGRVYGLLGEGTHPVSFYPGVVGAKWVPGEQQ